MDDTTLATLMTPLRQWLQLMTLVSLTGFGLLGAIWGFAIVRMARYNAQATQDARAIASMVNEVLRRLPEP